MNIRRCVHAASVSRRSNRGGHRGFRRGSRGTRPAIETVGHLWCVGQGSI